MGNALNADLLGRYVTIAAYAAHPSVVAMKPEYADAVFKVIGGLGALAYTNGTALYGYFADGERTRLNGYDVAAFAEPFPEPPTLFRYERTREGLCRVDEGPNPAYVAIKRAVNEDAVRALVEDPYNAADRLVFAPTPQPPTTPEEHEERAAWRILDARGEEPDPGARYDHEPTGLPLGYRAEQVAQ